MNKDRTDLEREIVGSILKDPTLYESAGSLRPEDMNDPLCREAWAAVRSCVTNGISVTPITIANSCFIARQSEIEQLAESATANPDTVSRFAAHLLDEIRTAALEEDLKKTLAKLREERDWKAASSNLMVRLTSDYAGYRTREAASVAANLKRRLLQNTGKPIPTGLKALDRHLGGGMRPSTMIGIGAFTKTGKTTLINTISYNLEEAGHPHLLFTLERREEDVEASKASRFLGCSTRNLASRIGDLDPYIARPRKAYYIHDTQITVEDIRHEILYHKRRYGIVMAGIDYWQLIQPSAKERRESNRERELSRAAQVLQQTSMDGDLCIIITCQLDDLGQPRESRAIKFAANLYMNMHRDQGRAETWFETTATNCTPFTNVGSINCPALLFEGEIGPYFKDPED